MSRSYTSESRLAFHLFTSMVQHLSKTPSDHSQLLLLRKAAPSGCRGMRSLTVKMKRLKQVLKQWNKNTFGDVYGNIQATEQTLYIREALGTSNKDVGSGPSFLLSGLSIVQGEVQSNLFQGVQNSFTSKIEGWKSKLLSPSGRVVLIKHVLFSVPTHVLTLLDPSKKVLSSLERTMADFFFLGVDDGTPKRH
ncbi:hypothetical protein ACH5RR_037025 [Cinchona calisaya]|uniref:Uncharacterized protein n=1 Tax=Cinchona calisaya TaxID=153742 RepID=A0ABD2Y6B7_9GENT